MTTISAVRRLVWWPVLAGLAVVLAAIEVAVLANRSQLLRSWATAIEVADGAFLVVGIVVAGAAAAVAAEAWQDRELTVALPDSGARTVAAAGLAVGIVAAAVHVATMAGLIVWGYASGLPGHPRLLPVLSVLVALVASALFGTAVVRLYSGALAPVLAVGLFVGLFYLTDFLGGSDLVDLGGASIVLVGAVPNPGAMLWRAAWLLAVAAVGWAVAAYGRRVLRPTFAALLVVTAALAVTTREQVGAGFSEVGVEWVCAAGPPKVCVAEEYDDELAGFSVVLARLASPAREVGIPAPTDGYRQSVGFEPRAGSFGVTDGVQPPQLAFDLVQFGLPCSVNWRMAELETADTVAHWILTEAGYPLRPGTPLPTLTEAQLAYDRLQCPR